MNSDLAAAGDLATGGLIGRAVEPHAGETAHGADGHGLCLNCGTALVGEFCHACGQTAHVHTTLSSIGHDLLHGVFHFDGKIWRTLPMLFTRPGSLTRRYIAGERARFVSPLALFLFSVFLMVATFETIGGPFGKFESGGGSDKSIDHIIKEGPAKIADALAKQQAQQATLTRQLDGLRAQMVAERKADRDTDAIEAQIDKLSDKLDNAKEAVAALTKAQKLGSSVRNDVMSVGVSAENQEEPEVHSGIPMLDERIKKAVKSPELFLYKLQSSAYKFSWLLIPISLPFIWLMFPFRRDVGPYDHAIFAIYSLSAMTIGVVGLSVLRVIGVPMAIIGIIFSFGPPLHMYKQLRGAYGIGRFGAAWRTIFLLLSTSIAGILFLLSVLSMVS
jgi:hypothetical protein